MFLIAPADLATHVHICGGDPSRPALILKDKAGVWPVRAYTRYTTETAGALRGATGQGEKGKRVIRLVHPTATAEMGHRGGKVRRRALSSRNSPACLLH